jgi:shikimate dehydrogenase
MRITARTKVAAVIGDPVEHSRSPDIHNAAFEAVGLDWIYTAFRVAEVDVPAALDAMRVLGIAGASVTMPNKSACARMADSRSASVEALGAANCLINRNGQIHAENTDGAGFLDGLAADCGLRVDAKSVAIVGAGGAARAVAQACDAAGSAAVTIINRDAERGQQAALLAPRSGRVGELADIAQAELVVNATPVGMLNDSSTPFDPSLLRSDAILVDLIYAPVQTSLLLAARSRGITAFNGISMLVHQAAAQFEAWTDTKAPIEAMQRVVSNGT